jgi:hypothetical protein
VLFAERLEELAFLLNVMVAGCGLEGRQLRPAEAAEVVLALCEVGLAQLEDAQRAVSDNGADTLFRVGWHLLGDGVSEDAPWSGLHAETRALLSALEHA